VLEAAYLVLRLPAWSTNRTQRLVSSPKCYSTDSALCSHLLGADVEALAALAGAAGAAGAVVEAFALMEIRKQLGWSKTRAAMHHLRTKDGLEVDLVLETPSGAVSGVEVKASATVGDRDFRGLRWLAERAGPSFRQGVVLYAGDKALSFGPALRALPFSALWA